MANTAPAPAPGATQPIGGFSALPDAGNGDFYAMPDNGFGSKANSRSFILRLPYQTIEAILPIGRTRSRSSRHQLRVDGPHPSLPDYSDFILVNAR